MGRGSNLIMDNELYWLWLMNNKGIGRVTINLLLEYFGDVKSIFHSKEEEIIQVLKSMNHLKSDDINHLIKSRDMDKIIIYDEKLKASNIHYKSIEHEAYPSRLKTIYDAPYMLYYKGKIPRDSKINIAIVGARRCTPYGESVAKYFAKELSSLNIGIVSGMARGIDTCAHKGAIEGNGKTIAVLGCGVNICYPKENVKMMQDIIHQGCVMSEFPINATPRAGNFPLRNRIISGLSDGVLVVEAAKKSGSLITADQALEQGRDVFSVPGRINDALSKGTNHLIKIGAKPVTDIDDILEEYDLYQKEKLENQVVNDLDDETKLIYSLINNDGVHIDEICRQTDVKINDLRLILVKLELKNMIKQLPNNYYIRNTYGG
jgi:DNA processing protein